MLTPEKRQSPVVRLTTPPVLKKGKYKMSEVTGERLKSFIERVERLEEEKKAISEDIKDIYLEAKSAGFDAKIIKAIVKLRKVSQEKRREEQELLDLYCSAIGLEI